VKNIGAAPEWGAPWENMARLVVFLKDLRGAEAAKSRLRIHGGPAVCWGLIRPTIFGNIAHRGPHGDNRAIGFFFRAAGRLSAGQRTENRQGLRHTRGHDGGPVNP